MRLEIDLAAAAIGDVRIALRRPEICVPEHLLDASKVGSTLEEMRCKRVAEQVRMHALGLETGFLGEPAQDHERACARQRPAARVEEELGAVAPVEVRPPE